MLHNESNDDVALPSWFDVLKLRTNVKVVFVDEWANEAGRENRGFLGVDFCHSRNASVRIIEYLLVSPSLAITENVETNISDFPKLIGPVYFSKKCESHKGLCHGGSMCAVMDDAIGWMGFCVSGIVRPWSGFTVQVNTSLKKAVCVGSTLKLEAWVNRIDGSRKFWISCRLVNVDNGDIHCEAEGLFLLNSGDL